MGIICRSRHLGVHEAWVKKGAVCVKIHEGRRSRPRAPRTMGRIDSTRAHCPQRFTTCRLTCRPSRPALAGSQPNCARGKVYAPHLGNQWQQTGTHFSMVTGRKWPTAPIRPPIPGKRRRSARHDPKLPDATGCFQSRKLQLFPFMIGAGDLKVQSLAEANLAAHLLQVSMGYLLAAGSG